MARPRVTDRGVGRPARDLAARHATELLLGHRPEHGEIQFDDAPHDCEIDIEVSVRHTVAEVGDVTPRDLGMLGPQALGDPTCCIGEGFQPSKYSVLQKRVGDKGGETRRRTDLNQLDAFQNMA